ncbi:hypothetical protein F2Q70_00026371 [Brassica cretica]|uniref:Uncharacterized protein n=1 Tax=Brassica cretica TaxID=69181 RepID=A0A8S9LB68_BRACR|nr:hypothetical protein F2Q70_00026371 [Brassica cretica]
MDALIKMLKDNGNIHGYSFGTSMIARTIEMTPNVAEIARIDNVKLFKMESGMEMKVVVTFKGSNYLVWSRMVKTAVGSKSLWKHITSGEAPMAITQEDGKALVTCTGAINPRGNNQDFIRRSEMDALIKRLKDNGNIHGYSFGASMIARTIEMTPNVAEIARIDSLYVASEGQTGRYEASGSKQRRVLLVFVIKSQRKLRLRRNEKRFDEDLKENLKEDLSEA